MFKSFLPASGLCFSLGDNLVKLMFAGWKAQNSFWGIIGIRASPKLWNHLFQELASSDDHSQLIQHPGLIRTMSVKLVSACLLGCSVAGTGGSGHEINVFVKAFYKISFYKKVMRMRAVWITGMGGGGSKEQFQCSEVLWESGHLSGSTCFLFDWMLSDIGAAITSRWN